MSYNRNMKYLKTTACALLCLLCLSGCGKKQESGMHYEIVDGQVVQVTGSAEEKKPASGGAQSAEEDVIFSVDENYSAGEYAAATVSDGVAMDFADEEYNSIKSADASTLASVKDTLNAAADACRDVYANAEKGEALNVDISKATIGEMISAIGAAGIPAVDSNGDFNMACWEAMDEFGKGIYASSGIVRGTYVVVYPDAHLSAFCLSRESGIWHLIAISGEWESGNKFRSFSEGRYSVGGVSYTGKGWLIYSRNTADFDENQKKNTDSYTMVRVKPYDSDMRYLAAAYIEPIGYMENNLFTTNWTNYNFGPIDFNSLYAYLFGMYNGTEMLSSYNVRSWYRAVGGTRLYLIPTGSFETVVQHWFDIDSATLKAISDYSWGYDGYFFLGYNRDYYNVTPRTPFPEVVDYTKNSDGSITMTVDAVNPWYGTDCAFEHRLTVMPVKNGFKYVSNELVESENSILPEQKLATMLDVEKSKLD